MARNVGTGAFDSGIFIAEPSEALPGGIVLAVLANIVLWLAIFGIVCLLS